MCVGIVGSRAGWGWVRPAPAIEDGGGAMRAAAASGCPQPGLDLSAGWNHRRVLTPVPLCLDTPGSVDDPQKCGARRCSGEMAALVISCLSCTVSPSQERTIGRISQNLRPQCYCTRLTGLLEGASRMRRGDSLGVLLEMIWAPARARVSRTGRRPKRGGERALTSFKVGLMYSKLDSIFCAGCTPSGWEIRRHGVAPICLGSA